MAQQWDSPEPKDKWKYEIINRVNREILVFYTIDGNVKGSIVLDTTEEKEEWQTFLTILGISTKD